MGHYCGWKNTGPTDDTFDLEKLVYAATTAKDDEICSLPLVARPPFPPGPLLPCAFSCKYTVKEFEQFIMPSVMDGLQGVIEQAHNVLTTFHTGFCLL